MTADGRRCSDLDYPELEVIEVAELTPADASAAVRARRGDSRRVPRPGESPGRELARGHGPFLGASEVAAVVTPRVAPHRGLGRGAVQRPASPSRGSAAARSTSGSRPGTSATSSDFPAATIVVREGRRRRSPARFHSTSSRAGSSPQATSVLYTPETVVRRRTRRRSSGPHLRRPLATAVGGARDLRRRGLARAAADDARSRSCSPPFSSPARSRCSPEAGCASAWLVGAAVYLAAITLSGDRGRASGFARVTVGLLTLVGLVATPPRLRRRSRRRARRRR